MKGKVKTAQPNTNADKSVFPPDPFPGMSEQTGLDISSGELELTYAHPCAAPWGPDADWAS